ncbi:MAG: hypothetical protein KDI37_07175 [Xanthomonadales bacterium]|nr:hypothetical protein [Xanthomonadales bacterium]MCB1636632.1 hypothetical protein [Xanthomonadales bacterium]MCB1641497.1 hypothetical protein [Xanthomonadales bacterium]
MRTTLFCLSLLAASLSTPTWATASDDLAPGSDVVLEGKVVEVVSHDTFWLDHDGTRVLVYQSTVRKPLSVGQTLKVSGRVSDDWMRLADYELEARQIEN